MKKFIIAGFLLLFVGWTALKAQIPEKETEKKIEHILSQLSLEEKVAMCHAQSKFSSRGVPRLGIPELWMSDGPHGVRAEINWDDWGYAGWTNDSVTAFPALTCLAATFNPEVAYLYGKALGEEARYRNKDVLLGPGVNIYRTPLNGRNFEYMGEDPFLASTLVVPYIKGVQENGVAACIKHFALNNQEIWRGHINVDLSDRALYEIYLPAYKAAVQEAKVWAVMGAYNKFRGQYCCHNDLLINKILKGDWGFDGVLITDWGATHNTREAALNGLDIEMGTWTDGLSFTQKFAYENYFLAKPFLNLLKSGEIAEEIVNDKVRRILRLMLRTNMNPNKPFGSLNSKEHHEIARKVATEGIVLLKNDAGFFPIDPGKKLTIAIIGENATRPMTVGGGSSELKAQFEISPLDGIKKRYTNAKILYSIGYASGPSVWGREIPSRLNADSLRKAAIETAKNSDLVIFIGGLNKNHFQDCEGGDRKSYQLPFAQNELIMELKKANKNLGIILISGNAVEMPWLNQANAIMQAWYLGSETGHAIADILSGDVNPSGKLPFSFPVKLSDNAAHSFGPLSYPGDSINQFYKEGILVGYRWHDTKKIKPQFAFGHGLSYTTFQLSEINSDKKVYSPGEKIKLSFILSNTGAIGGAEVVQVYVGKTKSTVERPMKELKGFVKLYVDKQSATTGQISIDTDKLAYYDESQKNWQLEKGDYVIYVGNSSDHIQQSLKISIK
jgi:beta-glucosidase